MAQSEFFDHHLKYTPLIERVVITILDKHLMPQQRNYVICYDIVEGRKRNRVAETLKDYGIRVQKSVFECRLNKESLSVLIKLLHKIIDKDTDSILVYLQCEPCHRGKIAFGDNTFIHQEDFRVI